MGRKGTFPHRLGIMPHFLYYCVLFLNALNRPNTLQTPGFSPHKDAQRLVACSATQTSIYTRYNNEWQCTNTAEPLSPALASTLLNMLHGLYTSKQAVLVPKALFNESDAYTFANCSFDILPGDTLVSHIIDDQFVQLFTMPKAIQSTMAEAGINIEWAHPAGIMLPAYQKEAEKYKQYCLFVYLQEGIVTFTLFHQGHLQSQHIQPFEHLNDILFTLLQLNAKYPNPQEPIPLCWHGEYLLIHEWEKVLTEKNWPAKPFVHLNSVQIPELPTAYFPQHQFISSCAL
jgi:hypothetical protein